MRAASFLSLGAVVAVTLVACTSTPPAPPGATPAAQASAASVPIVDLPRAPSSRRVKKDIRYIDDLQALALRDDVMGLRLATFHYAGEPRDAEVHVGFLIEDSPAFPAVDPKTQSVDLYSYLSMAVAAIQLQQAEIEMLHQELHAATRNACTFTRPGVDL